ncbi:MAG TPA: DUF924 family protein [Allosphingosinicella sp.]|jgi:uncharacterized protein (DUF924 family)|uniref:DUF924 family protein n=1 Tax=Allosphingosinicella sp. TaxID=2823234 RepID=UPI002F28A929
MISEPCVDEILSFWFGLGKDRWFKADPDLDAQVRERFQKLWETQQGSPTSAFLGSPREALAAVVLFDQFPRNMFRGHADQFATDHLGLAVAREAIALGYDDKLSEAERGILYMPFQHSEDLDDQQRSVALFSSLEDKYQLEFARKHRDVIERFGRFPHRNAILGRSPRADELAAGDVVPW